MTSILSHHHNVANLPGLALHVKNNRPMTVPPPEPIGLHKKGGFIKK